MRYLRLTEEENRELELLHKNSLNSVVGERSHMLLLSSNGMCVNEIAVFFNHTRHTVSKLLSAWENGDNIQWFNALSIGNGRGAKSDFLRLQNCCRNWLKFIAVTSSRYSSYSKKNIR